MRFLIHGAATTGAVADALVRHGHKVERAAEPGMPLAEVIEAARQGQLDLVTTDAALVDAALSVGAKLGRVVVYLQVEGGDVEQDDGVDRLFARYKRLTPGRVYTVTGGRVKVRQLRGVT